MVIGSGSRRLNEAEFDVVIDTTSNAHIVAPTQRSRSVVLLISPY
jgi:hypothetical protein